MKQRLLNFLICPNCNRNLVLRIFEENNKEIEEGLLICSCGQFFPIIKGIPRILVGDLRVILYKNFPEFFLKYEEFLPKEKLKKNIKGNILKKKKTLESFGFEWQKFSKMLNEWEKNFNFYFQPVKTDFLKDRTVLEVGCGKGRHTYYIAKIAKEIIAVDFSQAIDVASYNNKEHKNIHFIQADIDNLPFKKNFFDFIFCIGVLHHLPKPEQGFNKLVDLLKNNAGILIYVYHNFPKRSFSFYLLKFVNFFRRLTIRMPHNLLYLLCYPIAVLSYLLFVFPCKIFSERAERKSWPLRSYLNYPFAVLLNDTFDRFSAPIENRYTKEEILAWYQRANLKSVRILKGHGWRVFGKN